MQFQIYKPSTFFFSPQYLPSTLRGFYFYFVSDKQISGNVEKNRTNFKSKKKQIHKQ